MNRPIFDVSTAMRESKMHGNLQDLTSVDLYAIFVEN